MAAEESALDTFDRNTLSIYFPLPFRILFLLIFGVWLCALNFHYFHLVKIDIRPLIRYTRNSRGASTAPRPLHSDIYHLALLLTTIFTTGLVFFWHLTAGNPALVEKQELIPVFVFFACAGLMCWPTNRLHSHGRFHFLKMLRRVVIGGLDTELRFADVLLADVITSYAKVLGDTWVLVCMGIVTRSLPLTALRPDRSCGAAVGVPLVLAIPSLIRLRQCLTDWVRIRGDKGGGEARVHLWNAGKYASAFPVIWLSAVMREWDEESLEHWLSRAGMERVWLMAVFINSSYSFYWDVTRDWDLSLFTSLLSRSPTPTATPPLTSTTSPTSSTNNLLTLPSTPPPSHPWGLRPNRHYHAAQLYYSVILLDFLLRCTWSFKLSPHLGHLNDLEGGIFLMELLELIRRWMWMFLRVEKEWCARGEAQMNIPYMLDEEEGRGEEVEGFRLEEWRKHGGEDGGMGEKV